MKGQTCCKATETHFEWCNSSDSLIHSSAVWQVSPDFNICADSREIVLCAAGLICPRELWEQCFSVRFPRRRITTWIQCDSTLFCLTTSLCVWAQAMAQHDLTHRLLACSSAHMSALSLLCLFLLHDTNLWSWVWPGFLSVCWHQIISWIWQFKYLELCSTFPGRGGGVMWGHFCVISCYIWNVTASKISMLCNVAIIWSIRAPIHSVLCRSHTKLYLKMWHFKVKVKKRKLSYFTEHDWRPLLNHLPFFIIYSYV